MRIQPSSLLLRALLVGGMALVAGAGACGTSTGGTAEAPVQTVVLPAQSYGSVTGRVMDLLGGTPLAGATVTLLAAADGGFPTQTTGADGTFQFSRVPAGGGTSVLISATGHEPVQLPVTIPSNAGDFPTDTAVATVGPVWLLATDQQVSLRVLLPSGQPATNFTAFMELPIAWATMEAGGGLGARGRITRGAQGTDGQVQFTGLPNLLTLAGHFPDVVLKVTVGAPLAGDQPVAAGVVKTWVLGDILTSGVSALGVQLDEYDPGVDLEIMGATLPDFVDGRVVQLPGLIGPGDPNVPADPIKLMFNQPVMSSTVDVVVVDERGRSISAGPTSITRPQVAQLDGGPGPITQLDIQLPTLDPGAEYNMLVAARPVASRPARTWARPVYTSQEGRTAVKVLAVKRTVTRPAVDGGNDNRLFAGDPFFVDLVGAVGGRTATGGPVAAADFRPVLASVQGTYFDDGLGMFRTANFIAPCTLSEPGVPAPYTAGGFTTRLRCVTPNQGTVPANTALPPMEPTLQAVTITFNDSAARDDRTGTAGTVTITTADGTVVVTATHSGSLTLVND